MQRTRHIAPITLVNSVIQLMKLLTGLRVLIQTRPLVGLAILGIVLLSIMASCAEIVAIHDPIDQNITERLRSPNSSHYFGTDGFGRDVFSRVIHGSRVSLYVALLSVVTATLIGTSLGTISAYCGGIVDIVIQRAVDVLLGFPFLVLILVVVVPLGASTNSVVAALALALTPQVTRMARASGLSIKAEAYLETAKVTGVGWFRTIWRHMLPNSFPPILAQVTGHFGTAIVAETTLSFLGLGIPPPSPSWGRMIQEGVRQYFEVAPWTTVFPGLALSITVLSIVILGDALRDLLDPRSQLPKNI